MIHLKNKVSAFAATAALGLFAALAPSSAQACTKTIYVHYVSFGYTDYSILLNNKNTCWGLESPFWSGGASWSVCSASSQPSGGTRWAYNEITNPSTDQAHITACKNNNGGASDVAYVTPNSGGTDVWSHSGITGVNHYYNECYNSGSVDNQWPACNGKNGGDPMFNLAQAQINGTVSNSVYTLCHAVGGGNWIGFYSNGLDSSHTTSFYKAMNYCTTH